MYEYWAYLQLLPWAPPASEGAIQRLRDVIPEVPNDLVSLLLVTEVPAAGILDFMRPLGPSAGGSLAAYSGEVNSSISPLSFVRSDASHHATNRLFDNDDGWTPEGDLFWLQAQRNERNLGMAIGGPNHGRVYSMGGSLIQRIAYRLSDVVACTRDLYENGWFSYYYTDTYAPPGSFDHDPIELEERVAELVTPVVDRWHCSPRVACLVRHTEPTPPPDL